MCDCLRNHSDDNALEEVLISTRVSVSGQLPTSARRVERSIILNTWSNWFGLKNAFPVHNGFTLWIQESHSAPSA